jgi:hypothetical protein
MTSGAKAPSSKEPLSGTAKAVPFHKTFLAFSTAKAVPFHKTFLAFSTAKAVPFHKILAFSTAKAVPFHKDLPRFQHGQSRALPQD